MGQTCVESYMRADYVCDGRAVLYSIMNNKHTGSTVLLFGIQ